MKKPITALIILDGFGYTDRKEGNAIEAANTKNIDSLCEKYPHTFLRTSGLAVGLPEGQMGNSEVGHLNMGAGRIIYQDLTRISKDIKEGCFYENPAFLKAVENVKEKNSSLHLLGLLSDGGVHSHTSHLYSLLKMAKMKEIQNVYIHCFLDGRDTLPKSAEIYIKQLEKMIERIGIGTIATISGRYYAMDRDQRWERTQLAYDAIVLGKGEHSNSPMKVISNAYQNGQTDEFVLPTVISNHKPSTVTIKDNDSVIFFNYRPDRSRQLTRAIMDEDCNEFIRAKKLHGLCFITMTQYDQDIKNVNIAYAPQIINNTIGECISNMGMKQLRIAETEKYAHVTYFFDGGMEKKFEGEKRKLVPSPKVATYDLQPEMSAYDLTEKVLGAIDSGEYDFMVLNYANGDMVGHTGMMKAAVKAVETVDNCLKKVIDAILKCEGKAIITADHGSVEQMIDYKTGKPCTAHTTNPVICIIAGAGELSLKEGKLADVAPTLLELMNLKQPKEMTGNSLIQRQNEI